MVNNIGIMQFGEIKETPKRELLLFDKIIIPNLFENIKIAYDKKSMPEYLIADLEFLIVKDILSEPEFTSSDHKQFYNQLSTNIILNQKDYPNWFNSNLLEYVDSLRISRENFSNAMDANWEELEMGINPSLFDQMSQQILKSVEDSRD
ncbi:MAG: hypothetical protein AAFV80_14040, partial [Bacteroidota bacterium]